MSLTFSERLSELRGAGSRWVGDWIEVEDWMITNKVIGIVLAIVANLLIACSLVLQKWVHMLIAARSVGVASAATRVSGSTRASGVRSSGADAEADGVDEAHAAATKHPLFWCAIAGLIVGEVGNFAAFGLASPTVISPLGAVAVIANAVLAATVLREPFSCRNFLGLLFTIVGSVVVVVNSPPSYEELTIDSFLRRIFAKPSLTFVTFLAVTIPLLFVAEPTYGKHYLLINVMLCSLLGSVTVACSAAASTFIRKFLSGDFDLILHPASWCLSP